MQVIHSVSSLALSSGGPPRSVSELCNLLASSPGIEVSVITNLKPEEEIVTIDRKIPVLNFSCGDLERLFARGVASSSPNLIHQHGLWRRISHETTQIAFEHNVPLVLSPRGMLEPWALNNRKWKKRAAWLLYQKRDIDKVTAFHATALSEAENIRQLGFKQPIGVIPNGIVLPGASKATLQPNRKKVALFLSRINPKKGLLELLEAWGQISPKGWELVIAGNDDSNHLPSVRRKIRELGLSEAVTVVGSLFGGAKSQAYENADLFVLPSYSENFGIVVAEALSFGVPVLTTKGCPWQELEEYQCGWWVDATLDGISSGLQRAITTENEILCEMGQRGRRLVEEKYQWPSIADRMREFYTWIKDGGQPPDFVI